MAVRIPRAILLAPLAALASHGAASGASGPACDARGAVTGVIARFGDRLEPVLADGRTLRPLGLDPADRGPADSARLAAARRDLDATYGGATIQFRAIGGKADRWGRVPALIFLGDPPRPLAAEIVGLGDARARPETGALNCMAALLAAEASARGAGLGLWADPLYSVIDARDGAALRKADGRFAVVEGAVTKAGVGRRNGWLDFGPRGSLSAVVSIKRMRMFGWTSRSLQNLVGRRLRLRGLLDARFGPKLTLTWPEQVETPEAR